MNKRCLIFSFRLSKFSSPMSKLLNSNVCYRLCTALDVVYLLWQKVNICATPYFFSYSRFRREEGLTLCVRNSEERKDGRSVSTEGTLSNYHGDNPKWSRLTKDIATFPSPLWPHHTNSTGATTPIRLTSYLSLWRTPPHVIILIIWNDQSYAEIAGLHRWQLLWQQLISSTSRWLNIGPSRWRRQTEKVGSSMAMGDGDRESMITTVSASHKLC